MSLPVSMGPMSLPVQKPKRRSAVVVGWMLCAFAGGIAAGPALTDQTYLLVEGGAAFLETNVPWVLGKSKSKPAIPAPGPRAALPPQAAMPKPSAKSAPAAAPAAPQAEKTLPAEKPAVAARTPSAAEPAAPERAEPEVAEASAARHGRTRAAAKTQPVAAVASKREPEPAPAPAPKRGKYNDPFDAGGAVAKETAAPKREPKPVAAEHVAPAKSEPAPRAAKSADGLDNLMADVMTDNKGKGKKRENKDIDAMLKDVQKSQPAPAPKREAQAELPPLTSADISKAMAKVKTRGNSCAQQFGGKGVAELKLTVGKNGKVSDVVVGGKIADTPLATCIEKAARAAAFPPNAGLKFDYRIEVH